MIGQLCQPHGSWELRSVKSRLPSVNSVLVGARGHASILKRVRRHGYHDTTAVGTLGQRVADQRPCARDRDALPEMISRADTDLEGRSMSDMTCWPERQPNRERTGQFRNGRPASQVAAA